MIAVLKPAPRKHTRRTFSGSLRNDVLVVRRGAHVRTVDKLGDVLEDSKDERAQLWINLGDHVLVADRSLVTDPVAVLEIVRVDFVGWSEARYGVACRRGTAPAGECWVMSMSGLRTYRRAA